MKILAHCYTYGHNSASGADKMLQSVLEYLVSRGTSCRAVIDNCPQPYELNGVLVQSNKSLLGEAYDWCDAVIIHLVAMHEAVMIARRFNKPVIHIAHNNHCKLSEGNIIYNSEHLRKEMQLPLNSIVCNPPTVIPETICSHFNEPYITLVNTCDNKGGLVLKALAQQLFHLKFLGVHGGYDKNQMYQPVKNITYRPYTATGMDYSDTRILIVPSKAESWSLCAAEAMANGIPVICSDLPGLRENCGRAAIYASSVRDYMDGILALQNEEVYNWHVRLGRAQVISHNYCEQLNNLYNFIENICVENGQIYTPSIQNVNSNDMAKNVKTTADTDKKKVVAPGDRKLKQSNGLPKEKKEYKGLPTQK